MALILGTQIDPTTLQNWVDQHHKIVTDKHDSSKKYHVFAVNGYSNYNAGQLQRYDINTAVTIFGVTFKFKGYVDLLSLDADITVYADLPWVGEVKLGEFSGNLNTGIEITVGNSVISGSLRLFIEGGYVCLEYSMTIFGSTHKGTFQLFKLP